MNQLAEFLGYILKENNIVNYKEWVVDIDCALEEKRFEWVYKDEKCVGFYTWLEKFKDGKQYIYIGNFFIEPVHRCNSNTVKIRRYLKDKFPNAKGYWVNTKSKEFVYE